MIKKKLYNLHLHRREKTRAKILYLRKQKKTTKRMKE